MRCAFSSAQILSEVSDVAVRQGAALIKAKGGELALCHVLPEPLSTAEAQIVATRTQILKGQRRGRFGAERALLGAAGTPCVRLSGEARELRYALLAGTAASKPSSKSMFTGFVRWSSKPAAKALSTSLF